MSGQIFVNQCVSFPCAGHELEFVMAPNLHWPDTMFSFDSSTGVLYTCDAFVLHYCDSEPFDTDLKAIEPHFRFYYDCLMKPNARSVLSALKRVKDFDYSTIAVGHGPLLRYNLSELVGRYTLLWLRTLLAVGCATTCCFFTAVLSCSTSALSQACLVGRYDAMCIILQI